MKTPNTDEPRHDISNNVVCATSKGSDQPVHTLLTEQHLGFLCLKGGCTGSSESTHVKIPHCWKSHALAHIMIQSGNHCYDLCFQFNLVEFELEAEELCKDG